MEFIFHETQDGSLCAQHCLNSLLQGDYFSAVDLATFASELDKIEKEFLSANTSLIHESSNYDDSGFFSIQVIQKALSSFNLDLTQFTSASDLAKQARADPTGQRAYVLNFKAHWYTIRKISSYWFNLNSMLKKPELISDTYLSVLLAQLQNDGYHVFIVGGELPRSVAETKLREAPINTKQVLASQALERKHNTGEGGSSQSSNFDDDADLKRAIQQSLYENDLELDAQSKNPSDILYPSLAYEPSASTTNEEQVRMMKSLAMSLGKTGDVSSGGLPSSIQLSNATAPSTSSSLTADEVRQKRLEKFNNSQQQQQNQEKK